MHYTTLLCEPQLSPTCTTVLHYCPLSIYLDCIAKARQCTPLVNLPFQLTSSCWHRFVQSRAKYKTATVEMWSSFDGSPLLSGDRMLPLLYLIYLSTFCPTFFHKFIIRSFQAEWTHHLSIIAATNTRVTFFHWFFQIIMKDSTRYHFAVVIVVEWNSAAVGSGSGLYHCASTVS